MRIEKLSMEATLRLVRDPYTAGATEVLVQNVTVENKFENASSLKVMLPKDPKV